MHLAAVVRVVLAGKAEVGVILHGTIHSAVFLDGANLRQVARGQSADNLLAPIPFSPPLAVTVEELAPGCACDRALHIVVFGRGNSDTRHGRKDSIFFNGLADRALELIEVHAACLLHDFGDAGLALLEHFDRLVLRCELFTAAAHTAASEIDLAKSKLSGGVFRRVDLLKDLKIAELGCTFVISMGKLGVLARTCSVLQVAIACCRVQVRCHLA